MNDDALIHALARLDDAVKALEGRLPAALAPIPPVPADDGLQHRYRQLETRHAALRERTTAAVDRLTRLLDSTKGD